LDSSDARFSYNARSELYFSRYVPIESELEKIFLIEKSDVVDIANKYINLDKAGIASVEPKSE
jgi:predicted Zn-dependent peptidase